MIYKVCTFFYEDINQGWNGCKEHGFTNDFEKAKSFVENYVQKNFSDKSVALVQRIDGSFAATDNSEYPQKIVILPMPELQ